MRQNNLIDVPLTMRVVIYQEYGGPGVLELRETDRPVPMQDEILIRIHASTVTPLDWKFRSGRIFLARLIQRCCRMGHYLLNPQYSQAIQKRMDADCTRIGPQWGPLRALRAIF